VVVGDAVSEIQPTGHHGRPSFAWRHLGGVTRRAADRQTKTATRQDSSPRHVPHVSSGV